eukprot:TRINITY_DN5219_c0_g1_i1.p1 TRINITY_DN5219_c0_g1~~TRINITY_DN5219_c0_g1_i1.p1  ORF type:complete len:357 (-),score=96.45 TRINITY_DN5219_c0_g1_i1:26-1096(-)
MFCINAVATRFQRDCSVDEAGSIVSRFLKTHTISKETASKLTVVKNALKGPQDPENPPQSCFKIWRLAAYTNVQPAYHHSTRGLLDVCLNRRLLSFFAPEYQGILMAYGMYHHPDRARIYFDDPNVRISFLVRALVFCPSEGALIGGRVNKIAADHLGVIVHDVFNATIPFTSLDVTIANRCKRLGTEVLFKVSKLDTENGIMLVGNMKDADTRVLRDSTFNENATESPLPLGKIQANPEEEAEAEANVEEGEEEKEEEEVEVKKVAIKSKRAAKKVKTESADEEVAARAETTPRKRKMAVKTESGAEAEAAPSAEAVKPAKGAATPKDKRKRSVSSTRPEESKRRKSSTTAAAKE